MNFDKPPIIEKKSESSLEEKKINWNKSKKYLNKLVAMGAITLASLGVSAQESVNNSNLLDRIDNLEQEWGSETLETISMDNTIVFAAESDLLEGDENGDTIFNDVYLMDAFSAHFLGEKNKDHSILSRDSRMKPSLEYIQKTLDISPKYVSPDHYVILDDQRDGDSITLTAQLVDLKTGEVTDFSVQDQVNLDNFNEYDSLVKKLYEDVKKELL